LIVTINKPKGIQTKVKAVFLLGPAGVGKTTLIESLAKIMDIACVRHQVASLKRDEIEGERNYSENPKIGIILNTLLQAKKKHNSNLAILFLDEIDKAFQNPKKDTNIDYLKSWLLDLLNEELYTMPVPAFDMETNVENLIVVMAGNKDFIHNFENIEDQQAFSTRVSFLTFGAFDSKAKNDIAENYFKKLMQTYNLAIEPKHLKVLKEINNFDKLPGVRVLLSAIKDYVSYLNNQQFFQDWIPNEFNVKAIYTDRK